MRSFLLGLAAVTLLLTPACNFRAKDTEAEVAPVPPTPILDSKSIAIVEELESTIDEPVPEPGFSLDPAPAPPAESWPAREEASSATASSAEDVFESVARVLKGAVEGEDYESEGASTGSVFGSIGRALSKGFQEAATNQMASDE